MILRDVVAILVSQGFLVFQVLIQVIFKVSYSPLDAMALHHGRSVHLPPTPCRRVAGAAIADALLQMLKAGNALHRRRAPHLAAVVALPHLLHERRFHVVHHVVGRHEAQAGVRDEACHGLALPCHHILRHFHLHIKPTRTINFKGVHHKILLIDFNRNYTQNVGKKLSWTRTLARKASTSALRIRLSTDASVCM